MLYNLNAKGGVDQGMKNGNHPPKKELARSVQHYWSWAETNGMLAVWEADGQALAVSYEHLAT